MLPLARLGRLQPSTAIFGALSSQSQRLLNTMATPTQVKITPENVGLWHAKQTDEAAKKASELLQKDLQDHHVFFNLDGFHNHLPHHILALYGTGAGADTIQLGWDGNINYQLPAMPVHEPVVEDLIQTWDHARKYLGKGKHYPDFLRFFQREMANSSGGYEAVVNDRMLAGDAAADDLLARLFGGFLHPLIQLMYGVEWAQPAIVAEGLAQACVHSNDLDRFLLTTERNAKEGGDSTTMPSIASLLGEIRATDKLRAAPRMGDANKVRDGVLKRAWDEIVAVASKVRVRPEELEERTAEMFHTAVYEAAAAAFHPGKIPKFDFFLMHHINSAPIFLTFNNSSWISTENKVRLLEWKIRMDLLQYAARGSPALSLDSITSYKPKGAHVEKPIDVISQLHQLDDDDGHAIKLGRAALICQEINKNYEDKDWALIKGNDNWLKVHHLIVDSVRSPGERWVRSTGLDEAWKNVPNAKL